MYKFKIHAKFLDSLGHLSLPDQESVKKCLQILSGGNITPGMRLHLVGQYTSFSPNMDLRIISYVDDGVCTLLYVDHHDRAYSWAQGTTILASGIDSLEIIHLSELGLPSNRNLDKKLLLPFPVKHLLSIEDNNKFLDSIIDVSPEWQEWLLETYINGDMHAATPIGSSLVFSPTNDHDLVEALSLELPRWCYFLHPLQRAAVEDIEHNFIVLTGGPGTGKTTVLLNRLLALSPKGKENSCTVLLTYSQGLVGYILEHLRKISPRYWYVYPLTVLNPNEIKGSKRHTVSKRENLECTENGLILHRGKHEPIRVRELLIDELQDASSDTLQVLEDIIAQKQTRVIVATDHNQSIHRATEKNMDLLLKMSDIHYSFKYSYRSTRQILQVALLWKSIAGQTTQFITSSGLSGPSVRFIEVEDMDDQVGECAVVMRDLINRYAVDEIALIYCQYFNPSFKGKSREEDLLKAHPVLGNYYKFASTTKGREFFAGIIFISETFMLKDTGYNGNRLRINTLYVALTRFRDEVTVIYSSKCAIKDLLKRIND